MTTFLENLRTRFEQCRREKADLLPRLKALEQEENALRTLIEVEMRRETKSATELAHAVNQQVLERTLLATQEIFERAATSPLRRAVLAALADGEVKHNDEIVAAIDKAGDIVSGIGGRNVQGTLLSLLNQGVVRRLAEGGWQLVKESTPSD